MNENLITLYKDKIIALTRSINSLRAKSRAFIIAEILSFVVSIGFIVLFTVLDKASWTLGAALCVLFLYFYIRNLDTKNDRKIADAIALNRFTKKKLPIKKATIPILMRANVTFNPPTLSLSTLMFSEKVLYSNVSIAPFLLEEAIIC